MKTLILFLVLFTFEWQIFPDFNGKYGRNPTWPSWWIGYGTPKNVAFISDAWDFEKLVS